jgi:four helix bundle suffix protein
VATLIYDATVAFCERFVDKRSRTVDQMVQAARSGRQNIAEGSRASAASSQAELRLVNVARASLDELLLDYEDFLRQHGRRLWGKDDPGARAVRSVGWHADPTDRSDPVKAPSAADYSRWLNSPDAEVVANAIICLIHQANYLLDRQIAGLEQQFVREGVTASGLRRRGWRSGRSKSGLVSEIRPIGPIRLIGPIWQHRCRCAPSAASS